MSPRLACLVASIATFAGNGIAGPDDVPMARDFAQLRSIESALWPRTAAPRNCIAISGGGMRSGTVSIGVLSELARIGVLDKVDILSTSSGGGYAAGGLYAQYAHHVSEHGTHPASLREVLGPAYIRHVAAHGRLFQEPELPVQAALTLLAGSANLVQNWFFGMHTNTGVMAEQYRTRLRDTYMASPRGTGSAPLARDEFLLTEFSAHQRLPFLIMNGTLKSNSGDGRKKLKVAESIFEFSPVAFGSHATGWFALPAPDPSQALPTSSLGEVDFWRSPLLSTAVATSGAAFDSAQHVRDSGLRRGVSALNFDLGLLILNPRIGMEERYAVQRTLYPVYLEMPAYETGSKAGFAFRVTDAGHSENMATLTLIRRGCKNILMVDTEHDPQYRFEDVANLLRVAESDAVRTRIRFDPPARPTCTGGEKVPLLCIHGEGEAGTFTSRYSLPDDGIAAKGTAKRGDEAELNLLLLKLAIPRETFPLPERCDEVQGIPILDRFGPIEADPEHPAWSAAVRGDFVGFYYCHNMQYVNTQLWTRIRNLPTFPQQDTFDLNMSPLQVRAYVQLGSQMVGCNRGLIERFFGAGGATTGIDPETCRRDHR